MNIKTAVKDPVMGHAINELDVVRSTVKNNEKVNRKEGNEQQAELEKAVAESCDAAIKELAKPKRRFFPDRQQKQRLKEMAKSR